MVAGSPGDIKMEREEIEAQGGSELSTLKQERGNIKKNITNLKKKIEKDGEKMDAMILECRLEILESYFKQLSHIQGKIEHLCPADNTRGDNEDLFISTKVKILEFLKPHRSSMSMEASYMNATVSAATNLSRLPSLKLPKFDGKYAEYERFITSFNNMVDENPTISNIEKFNYLLNCLSGPALAVVEPFQVTEDNYPKALERLKDRYDNKVLIFLEHISALFSIPNMSKGDSESLRKIIDTVSAIRGSLLSIGSEMDVLNGVLIHIVLTKLDSDTKLNYDEKQDFKSLPSWDSFYELLSNRSQFLQSHAKKVEVLDKSKGTKPKTNFSRSSHTFVHSSSTCCFCGSSEHNIANCSAFSNLVVSERFNFVKRNGHCINCLNKGHRVSKCPSKSRCRVCKSSHHTLLHIYSRPENAASSMNNSIHANQPGSFSLTNQCETENNNNLASFITRAFKRALIPTAVVLIKDSCGVFQPVRALLDSCSEINFISEETAKRLHLKFQPYTQEVSGIGEVRTKIKSFVDVTVKSRLNSFEWSSKFAVTKSISSRQPGEFIETSQWEILKSLQLADPLFYKPQHIDLLISTEIFLNLLVQGKISLGDGKPTLQNTVFGWIVGGTFTSQSSSTPLTCNLAIGKADESIDSTLKRFWEVEDFVSTPAKFTVEEDACENHFVENVVVKRNGKIQVRLPFKDSPELLGNSLDMARKRFLSVERRLDRDLSLKNMYVQFMDEYLSLGHMSPYKQPLVGSHFVIPHHCVLRPQSTSTKLRVVFDGSARSSSNKSLNDILMVGPTIQQDLITTLFSFRLNKFALTADISKMYRQFEIDERDRKYQLILWRNNKEEPLELFQLNTVTYGLSSAPFLAIRSLFFIADRYSSRFPLGSKTLREDIYVDDILTGANDIETLLVKRAELMQMLKFHGLELAKWSSNCLEVVGNPENEVFIKGSKDEITKTLGMSWKTKQDVFCYRFELPDVIVPTKRSILSLVSKIYDLLGILSPIVIRCKIILQEIWLQNFDWDDVIDGNLKSLWLEIENDLAFIENIEIPRYVFTSVEIRGEVHGFADASQRAYGCCIYFRVLEQGKYKINLLIAKSKVAPIKAQSLPRLELCAAVLLSKTWDKIKLKMENFVSSVWFWTDSKIVLQWLKLHSSTLNCFVANRVSELQDSTRGFHWRHVPSKLNPADIVSRGCSAKELSSTIWFNGPAFLQSHRSNWPKTDEETLVEVIEQRKATTFTCTQILPSIIEEIIKKHSSYYKIIRIISYIYRFFNRCPPKRSLKPKDAIKIDANELNNTFWRIIAHIQEHHFKDDIAAISNGKILNPSLQKLTPFLHNININMTSVKILRVGGRLAKAPIPYDARFPALVPKNHRFIWLYIEHLHRVNLHAGAKVLLGIVRQKIWIMNARDLVRKVVRNCLHCFRYKPKLMEQIMGNLPADRLRAHRPFLVTGVDFCGPFLITHRVRGKKPYKAYIAVFVCFSSKATHLELVSDLSTNNFLLCLKRFVGRRGIPQKIYCDNATNFVGACNKLADLKPSLFKENNICEIETFSAQRGMKFCFIPPRAPHFGGLWEAAVKSAKTLLLKNLSQPLLTFEELQTLVIEVEAILNSRPIAPLSDDPNDGEALTPGHLLIGSSFVALPDETLNLCKPGSLNQWQRISFLKQQFWKSWSRDYLLSLQQRTKWLKVQPNMMEGQLVVIHEDNTPPQHWQLARVTKVITGPDGKVRVVELKSKNGTYRRPIHKVAPLPSLNDS